VTRPVGGTEDDVLVRPATGADDPAVLALLRTALGKKPEDPYETFFHWKHRENPFGRSPAWVAEHAGRVVGYRTFLRWEFETPGGARTRAVRAVDTATDQDFRGRGIFQRLTLVGLESLEQEGVDLVFNTPNDLSRPGYLKMGWSVVGRLPVAVRPRGPGALGRMAKTARTRAAADLWSARDQGGAPAGEVLARPEVAGLLGSLPPPAELATARSPDYLRWRYGLADLGYRAFSPGTDWAEGVLVGRVRTRGEATELAVCDTLTPTRSAARAALHSALRQTGADYAIGLGSSRSSGMLPLPGQGPVLTWRALSATSRPPEALSLGDVELF
jgi:GNAT superfamily N-acetyltransferase